jgi:Methyl-accepting chemotaxis protein (MCP) signalling domain
MEPTVMELGMDPRGTPIVLGTLIRDLGAVAAPTEAVFLDVGHALATAVTDLQKIEADFGELSDQIDGENALSAVSGIQQAVACIGGLSNSNEEELTTLGRLADDVERLAKRLAALRAVAGEVGVLAMNAKIQASQITIGTADFAVFTVEMARLAGLAQNTIDRARGKVVALADEIGRARKDQDTAIRAGSAELAEIRDRLDCGVAVLAERRRRAVKAVQIVRERSGQEAVHVAESVGQLQINDITCQRIDHVRTALQVLVGVLAQDSSAADNGALAAAVCRLQQTQLGRTAADYADQVDHLIANLRLMSADARAIVAEAKAAFSDGPGGRTSFAGPLEAHMERANRLLDGFIAARARADAVMEAVHASVADIVGDLSAVTSIDADMQIMGLNATLKCGRLGSHGRALGVIANELRACGKRTEDNAKGVSGLLTEISGTAVALHRTADDGGHGRLSTLKDAMTESLARLDALAVLLDTALARLEDCGSRVEQSLDHLAGRIHIHHDVHAGLQRVCDTLAELGRVDGAMVESGNTRDRVRELLSAHYTMASERLIHQLTDDGDAIQCAKIPNPETDVDDCFF